MSQIKSFEMEDIAYRDWSEHLDLAAASRGGPWLPAYGYSMDQSPLQEFFTRVPSPDNAGCQQQFFLETILEESPDDLCSESDKSGPGGWNSDSDADSVIHVTKEIDDKLKIHFPRKLVEKIDDESDDNDDDDDDDDDEDDEDEDVSASTNPTASRSSSSSLLAFESLEQHYEEVFRTSASNDPFGWRPGDSTSWRFTGSPTDPLSTSESSSTSSSNDTLHLSLSSSASFRSSLTNDSRLRVYRSFDSLNLFDSGASLSCSAADLSRSHNALDFEKEKEREQEEFIVRDKKLTATTANLSTIMDSPSELSRGKLARASFHCIPNHRDRKTTSSEALDTPTKQHRASEPCLAPRPQQSAENLSEDSGFCDSRSIQVLSATPDSSDYSGGEESIHMCSQMVKEERGNEPVEDDDLVNFSYGAPHTATHSLQSSTRSAHDDAHSFFAELAAAPTSDRSVYTPPCLTTFCKIQEPSPSPVFTTFQQLNVKSPSGEFLEVSEWDAVNGMASRLPALSAPNLYLGDDASLTHVPLKDGDEDFPRGRGVTFCPVVSEVSWRNSYSDSDSESFASSDPSTDEMSNRSLEDLCGADEEEEDGDDDHDHDNDNDVKDDDEEEIEIEEKLSSPALICTGKVEGVAKLNAHEDMPTVNGNGSSVETQLVAPTLTPGVLGHVVTSDAEIPNAGRISTDLPVRDVHASNSDVKPRTVTIDSTMDEKKSQQGKSKFGGFFERFSFRRLSNRVSSKKGKKKSKESGEKTTASVGVVTNSPVYEDVTIIPLHGPGGEETDLGIVASPSGRAGKPPLPPRVPSVVRKTPPDVITGTVSSGLRDGSRMPGVRGPTAIDSSGPGNRVLPRPLETDLDALEPADPEPERREGKKARSLMNLGLGLGEVTAPRPSLLTAGKQSSEDRARSMEFLLDKENQAAVMAPENELQKGGPAMSEHQLRVQRSLQKLNVPDWYRNSPVASAPQGFLLKRTDSSQGWPGLGSKTTSLSSLGSVTSTRSPTSHIVSPTPHVFTRWSTSRLNSGHTSSSTSPCGSARSSFHYRQPYLGWRSQERLTKRTPAERLAAGLLPLQRASAPPQQTPSLTEVRTSIKEVTSAIVHYVSGANEQGRVDATRSPRGSNSRLCWVESSFVGTRPVEQPETPLSVDTRPDHMELQREDIPVCLVSDGESRKGSMGSATLDDILDSLLGLPPSSRSPSPRLATTNGDSSDAKHGPGAASGGGDATPLKTANEPMVRCRYSKCGKTATVSEAKRSFKTCHNCAHVYCSRECRRSHWERHRRTCLHSRVGALCRQVLAAAKEDTPTRAQLSLLARRGYLTHGRGAVKCFFSCPEAAERFVTHGLSELGEPAYVRWPDLLPAEMGTDLYTELMKLCKTYNPDTRLVLYVAVCVLSEVPTSGAVKWERQLVSRCCKVRLEKSLLPCPAPPPLPPRQAASEGADITREMGDPDTLILTSLPGTGNMPPDRAREVCVSNVQRELRQRGVSLRKQFPEVYRKLVAYAESPTERFPPTTIYPRDAAGRSFMCIIMPDADPEKLELVPKDSGRVTTIDVGVPS